MIVRGAPDSQRGTGSLSYRDRGALVLEGLWLSEGPLIVRKAPGVREAVIVRGALAVRGPLAVGGGP